jgi:DNA repair protein RadC
VLATADDRTLLRLLLGPAAARTAAGRSLGELLESDGRELRRIGLRARARRRLLASAEIARRHQPAAPAPAPVATPRLALAAFGELRRRATEVLAVLLLDARLCPLQLVEVASGAVAHVGATPREVFAPALSRGASAILLAHNHPSGQSDPSQEDTNFTGAMAEAGRLLDVPLLDHLVVCRRSYFSYREAGML